ncbi:MAG TPA: hypothetical protein VN842_06335, partial [Thermoplasmata archaeon]|nr:hypothetical protein [Thermoplasmata archaeon]
IQQNFFVADALGAPIYWVQNVIYINGTPGAWQMNFSGWVVYPFWGIYYNATIYEYNFPVSGQVLQTPLNFSIVTTLENTTTFDGQSVVFSFGIPGASNLTLPLPGGSYILGNLSTNYSWGGNELSNNPLEGGAAGSLSPQFGLVGGPSAGLGTFTAPTGGTLQLSFQRFGSTQWVPGATEAYGESIDQTGESSSGLLWTLATPANWTSGAPANWTLGVSAGSSEQGVLEYDPFAIVPTSPVTISETGLPAGEYWSFLLNTGDGFDTNLSQVVLPLANGTYFWTAVPPPDYSLPSIHGEFSVNGVAVEVSLTFTLVRYNVTLVALALPSGYVWWANVTETFRGAFTYYHLETNTTRVTFAAPNSSLEISFAAQSNWTEQPRQVALDVSGQAVVYDEAFAPPPKFAITFVEQGLPVGSNWTLRVPGATNASSTSGTQVNLLLENGSYSYTAQTTANGYFGTSGAFAVDGVAREILLSFRSAVYAVTFTESGLPAGSLWAIHIVGGPYLSSQGVELDWSAVNGTYNYTVLSEPAGWTAAPFLSGQVSVVGGPASVALIFFPVEYAVTFEMSGLPAGATWGVSLDGQATNLSTSPSLFFALPNGTYSYSVSVPAGWSSAPAAGTFTVSGQSGSLALEASQRSATSGTPGLLGLGVWGYVLIALVAVAAIAALGAVVAIRRPRPPPPKPEPPPSEPGAEPPSDSP